MEFHPVVAQIRNLLEENKIPYKFFEHEAVRTSEEAQALRPEYKLCQGAKAIILRCKISGGERKFIMCILPGDMKLDADKVKLVVGAKGVSFATKEESDKITGGIEFGGVPPFGNLFSLPVYMDPKLAENEEIIFNCGDRRASIAMQFNDWEKLVRPIQIEITL